MLSKESDSVRSIRSLILGIFVNFFITLIFIYASFENIKLRLSFVIFLIIILIFSVILQIMFVLNMKECIKKYKENKKIYHQILESLPNAVLVHKQLKFIYANKMGAKFFNLEKTEDLIGRKVEEFVKLNLDAIGEERLNNALKEKEVKPLIQNKIYKINGEVVDIEVFTKPIYINEKVALLNVFKDITEQKRFRELEEKIEEEQKKLKETMEMEKLKNEFFANLSHEFRTPLTIILGIVQLIEKDLLSLSNIEDSMKRRIKVLKQNCYRLLRLIGNLIDMTKIDAGFFSISLQNHEIISIIEDITLSVVDYTEDKGIEIEFDTEVEEKITACDPDKIERIILNLLSNAMKFTNDGGSIKVRIFDEIENIKIVVKDTGIGIPANKIDTIFDRFVQVDKSFTRNHEGSGIGLSIVKAFVEMHNGTITVESEYGKGTTFIIRLPINVLPEDKDIIKNKEVEEKNIQRVNIEFSDIYS